MAAKASLKELLYSKVADAAPELVRPQEDGAVQCLACGNRCVIPDGDSGICRMRINRGGRLLVPHGYVAGLQVDPIEKKPFYHVYPGRDALSFGMLGCNLHCDFCQNWVSSQTLKDEEAGTLVRDMDAASLVRVALEKRVPTMVSTYNEPLITADWAVEVFQRAHERGILCGFVSNGNASPEVLEFIRPHVQLYKVDLKTFDEAKYRHLGCSLKNVLDTIERLRAMGFWIEVVTLVVPGFNDDDEQLNGIARFIAGVSPDIPWHVTAFHPDYRMTGGRRTSPVELDRAYYAGKEAGLHFVYAGNLPGSVGDREHTFCPSCGALLIRRLGFYIQENRMAGACCPDCCAEIPGVWESEAPKSSEGLAVPRPV
ncbi:MAG: AmmeMemoRadiSam system radical SAM enzyme [Candidatus Hydrogenedentes bacterium]|nr:AmmeMemoRadiSam system radical SAM enzyme [Candidatus Hydrogenedentota bacterium]